MIRLSVCWFTLLVGGGLLFGTAPSMAIQTDPDGRGSRAPSDTASPVQYDVKFATGYSQIATRGGDPERFVSLSLLPELYYRKFGVGLLGRIHLQPRSGTLRKEDFDRADDYLGLLYFVEYGQESDTAAHARLGVLEEVSFGYGHFMDRYANDVSLDDPMRGLTGAVNVGRVRLEGVFNELANPGVLGLHGAYFPLGQDPTTSLPRMQVGLSIAGDVEGDGSQINTAQPGEPFLLSAPNDPEETPLPAGTDDGALFMVGIDAGIRLLRTETISVQSFVEASKILDYGIGASLGLRAATDIGPVHVRGQYIQLILGPEFLPDYFDSTYEVQRIRGVTLPEDQTSSGVVVNTKRNELLARQTSALGYQTRVSVDYDNTFESSVGYQTILGEAGSDEFTFDFRLHSAKIPVTLRLGYDRFGIDRWSDVFVPSREDALYRLGAAYQIISLVRLGVDLRQSYEPVYRGGRKVGRTKQNRFVPFVHFTLRF